jgi:hypothetical protein
VFNPWLALTFKAAQLGMDAQRVIALRMMRLAAGGMAGQNESLRMISEKIAAVGEAQAAALSAIASGQKDTVIAKKVLRVFEKRIRANKRRLTRN